MNKVLNFEYFRKRKETENVLNKVDCYLSNGYRSNSLYSDGLNEEILDHIILGVLHYATFEHPVVSVNISGIAKDFGVTNYKVKKVLDDLIENEVLRVVKREKGKQILVSSANLLLLWGEVLNNKYKV